MWRQDESGRVHTELHAAIVEAHAQGASVQLIARAASLSRQRVQQIIAAAK
jgi:hypothetical protein